MSPSWRSKIPPLLSLHENEQVDSCPRTVIVLGELRCPLEKLQQHSGIKILMLITQEEKEEELHLPASSHHPAGTSKKEIPCWKAFALAGKGRVGWATCFHSLFRVLHKGLTLVSPHSDTGKAETFEEDQGPGNRAEATNMNTIAGAIAVPDGQLCIGCW